MSFFTLERARSSKRVTWLTLVGILLVPLAIGGLLVWALWNPTERLGDVKAAVVNLDQPITINGQMVPLGRQLSAGLVDSKSTQNYSWVLTDEKDAAAGLANGTYVTVVTIPKNFSAAATSYSGAAASAKQATIDVQGSNTSKLVDSAISQAVTTTATSVLNKQLTSTYLENVYVGFNTLHDQLAKAADGAGQLSTGTATLASGTHSLASASASVAGGVSTLGAGLHQLAGGASSVSGGVQQLSGAAGSLAGGLGQLESKTTALPAQSSKLAAGAQGLAATVGQLGTTVSSLSALSLTCHAEGGSATFCAELALESSRATALQAGLEPLSKSVATGVQSLSDSMPALTGGIAQSASGASQLAGGLSQSASGASQVASGVSSSASGADQLASGAVKLTDGLTSLAGGADQTSAGTASLASGLKTAVAQLPTYSSSDRTNLATVAAQPVASKAGTGDLFGASSIPLFAVVALWLGALATFLVLQAVSARALLTTRSSTRIALGGYLPAVAIGIAQGLLVAGIMQAALKLDVGHWFAFAGVAALTGIAFAAINQGLIALFGGIGRFVSMLVVVITLASGIISTVPGFFDASVTWLPTSAAITAMQGVVDSTSGVWRGVGALILWAVLGLGMAVLAVARKRTVRVAQLAALE